LTHTIAVVENVRPLHEQAPGRPAFDFRVVRLAALFHDVGKPRTRGFLKGKGVTFYHHEVVGARMTRTRLQALRYSNDDVDAITELVHLHLRFHGYEQGWTDSAVRRYVNDAGPLLAELNVLTRCDCTTRNEKKALMLSRRMDDLEARIAALAAQEELQAIRPEMDGSAVMAHLGLAPGPLVGKAMKFLLELRLEEGLLGQDVVRERLDAWWSTQQQGEQIPGGDNTST
jgi:poly(A) polymerase